jgi:MATE family multidrug resistance protein
MIRFAIPMVLAELGWMAMGIVDTMMVGRVPDSASAIGGVSLGSSLFYAFAIFGIGVYMGLDTLVSHSFGAGNVADCHRSLWNSLWLALPLTASLMGVVWALGPFLGAFGVHPDILRQAIPYLHAISWSTLPLLVYTASRRYLQGMSLVRPVTLILVSANAVNALANWILIYGKLGAPALGAEGAGWATTAARVYMAAMMLGYVIWHDHRRPSGLWQAASLPDWARIARLLKLGVPAALQFSGEVSVFAATATLIGKLGPDSLAGHQLALNTASLTYMVPLGSPTAPSFTPPSPCSGSPRSSNCSTPCRPSLPGPSAASATPVPRCWRISSSIGQWGCPSATGSASIAAGAIGIALFIAWIRRSTTSRS